MAIIKGSLTYDGDVNFAPLKKFNLEFMLPLFAYKQQGKLFRQVELQYSKHTVSRSLSDGAYEIPYSGNSVIGEDLNLFMSWIRMVLNFPRSIDDFKLDIPYSIVGPNKVLLGHGSISALFFFEDIFPEGTTRLSDNIELTYDSRAANKMFLVNSKEYFSLLAELEPIVETELDTYLLGIIKEVGKFSENRAEQQNLDEEEINKIVINARNNRVIITPEIVAEVDKHFKDLTSFPIRIEEYSEVNIAGLFSLNTTPLPYPRTDLAFYHLSVEATIRSVTNIAKFHTLGVDWDDDDTDPIIAPVAFSRSENQAPLIISSIDGSIIVRVVGFDGTTLWRQIYEPDSLELEQIEIVIDSHLPGKLEGDELENPVTGRRILGQVLATDKSIPVSGLTVIIQAKDTADAIWRIVSAGETKGSGYFSLKYPKGQFKAAQAIVSVSPDSVVDIDILETEIGDETLSGDFLYLMIDLDELPEDVSNKDGTISRLPENVDLISSNEYTQDLGQCVNVTTPNRSLREYSYNAIVRISDPDVANYTLERTPDPDPEKEGRYKYNLVNEEGKIERAPVDLSNPIRWQDAPGNNDNLSFYQAVTVATGHILFFKSVFKADGYSMGECVYSLPLAPGQKKQIVSYDVSNTLEASESQQLSQGENISAGLFDDRDITNELSGGISETLSGRSSASTAGVSAGTGLAGTYGFISGTLGIAGGYANSNSSASQSGSRNITQHFSEKLRQSLIQNSESYRELNASVVTTVKEGQEYAVTTEVVSNHNHCHSVTMMYFEVLRHYAICQELSDVQECLFVPMLLTEFTRENISKWKDVLALNLRPIPSNTYIEPTWLRMHTKLHPLVRAFDANERIKNNYTRVEFPEKRYADESITSISGEFSLRVQLPRPKTRYDRIISLPIVTKTISQKDFDLQKTLTKAVSVTSIATGGLSNILSGPSTSTTKKEIQVKARIFDQFMTLDDNFQSVPPAQAIRVNNFYPINVEEDGTTVLVPFFQNQEDRNQWEGYSKILGINDVHDFLNSYFKGRLISEWDDIYNRDIAPLLFKKIINSINIEPLMLDLTQTSKYNGGERLVRIRLSGTAHPVRAELPVEMRLFSGSEDVHLILDFATLVVQNVRIQYSTANFNSYIFNGFVGNDLLDEDFSISGVNFSTPLNSRDKRNPKKEDEYLAEELIEHLNSNLEHYNKVLWRNLDPDRRYMLLDGFNIETYDRSGVPIGFRSLASVVKNELITITGNSLVFPVADGFNLSQSLIVEESEDRLEVTQPSLLDRYRPVREVEPYRLSVPTKGVYMEAVMGKCDACEEVKENSSQDWDKFRTEEPTGIAPVITPTPTRTDWQAIWAQFAQPLVELQAAGPAPAPGVGLSGLSDALAKSSAFRDVTGLEGNQENVIKTYLSNQENAKAFAEMAKNMAMQQHNTENSKSIQKSIDDAKKDGSISDEEASELKKDHISQQIDGGARQEAEEKKAAGKEPSLTNAAIDAVKQGRDVSAIREDSDGTTESLKVGESDKEETLETIFYDVPLIPQPNKTSCWAAAMAMLESYRQSKEEQMSIIYPATELADDFEYSLEQSYTWDRLNDVKEGLGLETITLSGKSHPSPKQWHTWLNQYGPLYVTIVGEPTHAIIVHGISGDTSLSSAIVNILNPTNTRIAFDADETVFNPPNDGLAWTLSVEELNQAFNGGELDELKFYENWRILYHPDLAPEHEVIPSTTGQAIPGALPTLVELRDRAIIVATSEALLWTDGLPPGSGRLEEGDAAALARLEEYYWAGFGEDRPPGLRRMSDIARRAFTDVYAARAQHAGNPPISSPWSAVFISWCYVEAARQLNPSVGLTLRDYAQWLRDNNLFAVDRGHAGYVSSALNFRNALGNPVYEMRVDTTTPVEVGDWIYYGRPGGSHVDIVVQVIQTQAPDATVHNWAIAAGGNISLPTSGARSVTAGFKLYVLDNAGLLDDPVPPTAQRPDTPALLAATGGWCEEPMITDWKPRPGTMRGLVRLV